ncbi:hypothetical protein WN944_006853 [Citrus x changshan-huyou]|uniref:Uncharacterized protein n=1 Tax=Citrus x changshan-huyou TaxID=2935761 RepID=A0AAP0MMF1_9ROSI
MVTNGNLCCFGKRSIQERLQRKIMKIALTYLKQAILAKLLGLAKGVEAGDCEFDKDCDKICYSSGGKCPDGICECPSGKFVEQKFSPDHRFKK